MKIPDSLGSLDDLKRRAKSAFDDELNWFSYLSDVYEYFLPQRNLYDNVAKGQKKDSHIFDGTAQSAIKEGANKLQKSIAPIAKRWARVEPADYIKAAIEKSGGALETPQGTVTLDMIQERLDDATEIAFDYLDRSNFSTQFYEACLDLLVGTATIYIQEEDDLDEPFSFKVIPQRGLGLSEGPRGTIEDHWKKFKVKNRNIKRQWQGFELSSEAAENVKQAPDDEVTVVQGIIYSPTDRRYYGVAWLEGEDKVSWVADYDRSSPMLSSRYLKVAGETRGRGPAMDVYPDVRSLNKVKEFTLQKSAIDIAGMWTATDDGVINPYNLSVAPGVVIPVGSNSSTNPTIQRLDTSTNLNLAQFQIEDMQMNIRRAFFNDLRDPTGPVKSATEIAIEHREMAQRMGSAFGRMQSELLTPILKRVFYILNKKGVIDTTLEGFDTTVKFTSPLARAQDQEDLLDVQQAIEFTMMTGGEEAVRMAFNTHEFGTYAAQKIGVEQKLVSSDDEKQRKIDAGAQMAMAQMEAQPNAME